MVLMADVITQTEAEQMFDCEGREFRAVPVQVDHGPIHMEPFRDSNGLAEPGEGDHVRQSYLDRVTWDVSAATAMAILCPSGSGSAQTSTWAVQSRLNKLISWPEVSIIGNWGMVPSATCAPLPSRPFAACTS